MKASSLGLVCCLVSAGTCDDAAVPRKFVRIDLADPQNWFAKPLLTGRIISGFSEVYNQSNADAWANSILDKCKANDLCTSCISLSADNNGDGRKWYGYLFKGKPTSAADYERMPGKLQDSVIHTEAR
ncbi:hypothetical protein JDV02_004626 [Purpureocillium takamizusanense]|uniref:Uncharacterized protein n=1 Tax=Purpureocillium takamizusanense TaxID=2060973 RepID=A0A9Q8QE99_9HYPO|nr:uncharacterized protein JDV02_004626 [Purpureocillium takamizusanense]UNI18353.1 hypothetical protein JDV02_004626 [Purpureocillium takamizusanense]